MICFSTYQIPWYNGMPSACYAADPGSNPGKGNCEEEMALHIHHLITTFVSLSSETFWMVWICRVANDVATISQMMKKFTGYCSILSKEHTGR